MLLELITQLLHLCHISGENTVHDSLADNLDLVSWEEARKEVIIVDVEQLEGLRGVEVLLD